MGAPPSGSPVESSQSNLGHQANNATKAFGL
jgi:hypothetical protein